MFEKRHKINKFANYQNIIVRNSPAFDCHVFVFSQDRWSMVFDVMRMISTQIRWQDPCWSLCKYPDVSLSMKMCAQRKAGRTLPMVPCGSSPVTRVSRSPLRREKRSAWGRGWYYLHENIKSFLYQGLRTIAWLWNRGLGQLGNHLFVSVVWLQQIISCPLLTLPVRFQEQWP